MNASHNNGQLGRHLSELRRRSLQRRTLRQFVFLLIGWLLLLLVTLLSGCAKNSMLLPEPQTPVLMPALSQPLPQVDYSISAQRDIQSWQTKLKGMFQTSEL